jgi:hypothetical protein
MAPARGWIRRRLRGVVFLRIEPSCFAITSARGSGVGEWRRSGTGGSGSPGEAQEERTEKLRTVEAAPAR